MPSICDITNICLTGFVLCAFQAKVNSLMLAAATPSVRCIYGEWMEGEGRTYLFGVLQCGVGVICWAQALHRTVVEASASLDKQPGHAQLLP